MMKTVLITGSNGLLGQKLVAEFCHAPGWQVVASSFSPDRIAGKGYQFELMDITSAVEVDYILQKYQPAVVINTAAMTQVDSCEEQKEECLRVNVNAVEQLVKACNRIHAHLIHLSSDFVFNGTGGPYEISDVPAPLNYYGEAKAMAERHVLNTSKQGTVVRTSLVYGLNPDTARPNIVLWLRYALRDKQTVKVNNDQFRTPTLVEDLAAGCRLIAEQGKTGIFHLAGPDYLSVLELAYLLARVFDLDSSLIVEVSSRELNEKGRRPGRGGLSIRHAREEIGYQPHSLEEGLQLVKAQFDEPRFTLDR